MNKNLKNFLDLILLLLSWTFASIFSTFFRYDLTIPKNQILNIFLVSFYLFFSFNLGRTLDRRIFGKPRKGSIEEFYSLSRTFLLTGGVITLILIQVPKFILPRSIPLLASILALGTYASLKKVLVFTYSSFLVRENKELIGIYGAGDLAQTIIQQMLKKNALNWKPIAILDDDINIKLTKLSGIKVFKGLTLENFLKKNEINILIITFSEISSKKLQEIQMVCDLYQVQLKIIPPIKVMTGTEFSLTDIRRPTQEELIGKSSIKPNLEDLKSFFEGKIILVTGAGGSIGSEISRQISSLAPEKIYLLDRDESALLDLELSINFTNPNSKTSLVLADIRDKSRVIELVSQIRPNVILHAAALKHLNLLEETPQEAFKTNIEGTHTLLLAASNVEVDIFVNISTDKAADPISVLGKSKLYAEKLTAYFAATNMKSKFISVRFGNVFGSRGSVMQTFNKQIELDLPITITDPKVSRYFMTVEDAVYLVLRAASRGKSGETLILNMGNPILIKDLAEKLVKASGKSIPIKFSSLKPGEKIAESLIGQKEEVLENESQDLLRIKVEPVSWEKVFQDWNSQFKEFY